MNGPSSSHAGAFAIAPNAPASDQAHVPDAARPSGNAGQSPAALQFRRFPYPYRAMAAICSDLDETPDAAVYFDIARFLNTTEMTRSGRGVGLEVGNSLYFDMPPGQFAYWNTDDAGRAMARALLQSRHIDCIHSYGDLATTRDHAARALEEMAAYDCRPEVWVDHATAASNFGADIMAGSGDVPGSPVYHADLTCDFGVRYVWRGRVTSVIGQDVPRSLAGIADWRHPWLSVRTLAKEWVKGRFGRRGNAKYAMHGPNELCRPARLRDGRAVVEFIRCNPCCEGVERMDDAAGIGQWLTGAVLERLTQRGGSAVFYTHLGKIRSRETPFEAPTRRAFEMLAEFAANGKILMTTTRRLLGYQALKKRLREDDVRVDRAAMEGVSGTASSRAVGGTKGPMMIELFPEGLQHPLRPSDIDGLTFYWPMEKALRLRVAGQEVGDFRLNPPDETGHTSVSLPWRRLVFPDVVL